MHALQKLKHDFFTRSTADAGPPGWWEHRLLWLAIAALSLLPFILSPLPPMADLLSHIGRYHVMVAGDRSEFLPLYYAFHWTLIGNLGQDLLVYALAPLMGVEKATFFLTALIPPATIMGIRQLSMAIHQRVHPGALVALPFVFAFPLLFGFANYCMGIALCLWVIVLWCHWRERLNVWRIGVLVLVGSLVWLVHMAAWAVTIVAVGSIELTHGLRQHGWRPVKVAWDAFLRVLPLAIVPVLLTLLWRSGVGASPPPVPPSVPFLYMKTVWIAYILRDQSMFVDFMTLALVSLAALWLLVRRNRIDAGLGLAALVLITLFWIMPLSVFNSFFADLRLLVPFAIFILVAFDANRLSPRARSALAGVALAVFLLRLGLTTYGWVDRGYALKDDLRALEHVERGARIAVLTPNRMFESWENSGLSHVPSLAIVRRDAFVNTQWDNAGSQLMRPIYNAGRDFNDDVSSKLKMRPKGQGRTLDDMITKLPRDRFDYVWLFRMDLPPAHRQGLEVRFRNRESVLYAIVPKAPPPAHGN